MSKANNQTNPTSIIHATVIATAELLTALSPTPVAAAPAVPVAVTNTPTVNAHVTNPSIGVSNTSATPLFVDTGSSAHKGMGSYCDISGTDTLQCKVSIVPSGQILVIETITCYANVVENTPFGSLVLTIGSPNPMYPGSNQLTLNHSLMMTRNPSADYAGLSGYGLISSVRMYAFGASAASGTDTPIYVFGNVGSSPSNATPSLGCAISGHFEDQ